jgi:hypothetical protein
MFLTLKPKRSYVTSEHLRGCGDTAPIFLVLAIASF